MPELDLEHRQLNFFSTIDPLTRDARDTALVLKVIAGPDGRAMLSSVLPPAPDYLAELDRGASGAKLLWMDDLGFAASYATAETPRVATVARQAAQGFAAIGATVAPGKGQWSEPRAYSSMLNGTYSGQPMARRPSDEELLASLDMREKMRSEFAALLARYDAIALPTALTTAPTLADWDAGWRDMGGYSRAYTANTLMFNFLALPAISIPVGFLDGMPVGLQLVGLPDSEPKLLRLANAYLKKYPRTERPNLA